MLSVPKECYSCFSEGTDDDPYPLWQPIKVVANPVDKYDIVHKPKHYMLFEEQGIEVRDVIEKLVLKVKEAPLMPWYRENSLFESDYVQMMQYLMRFMDKNGLEDLKKANWYLNKLIEAYEAN